MDLIYLAAQRDLEHEIIIDGLAGALALTGLTAGAVAERAGVSAQSLSYVLNGKRLPMPETARAIANALPLTPEQRDDWLGHVEAHRALGNASDTVVQEWSGEDVPSLVNQAREAHERATFAESPEASRRYYRAAQEIGERLRQHATVRRDPFHLVEICFVLHDVYGALNRPHEALMVAKQARFAAEHIDARDYPDARERIDFVQVNTLRAEGVAYHNLKLEEQALRLAEQAEQHPVAKRLSAFWLPHIYRDQINALAGTSRFSIRDAQRIANRGHDACAATPANNGDLLHFLLSRSLANAYLRHDNPKASVQLFDRMAARLDGVKRLGVLHRVMFMRSATAAHAATGDKVGADHWRTQAIALAEAGGLHHQLAQLRALDKDRPA